MILVATQHARLSPQPTALLSPPTGCSDGGILDFDDDAVAPLFVDKDTR